MKQHEVKNQGFPVYVPGSDGEMKLEVASATLKAGTLVLEFNDRLPGQAIQGMIARGALLGLAFILLETEEDKAAKEAPKPAAKKPAPRKTTPKAKPAAKKETN